MFLSKRTKCQMLFASRALHLYVLLVNLKSYIRSYTVYDDDHSKRENIRRRKAPVEEVRQAFRRIKGRDETLFEQKENRGFAL